MPKLDPAEFPGPTSGPELAKDWFFLLGIISVILLMARFLIPNILA
jgi:hypothetical protein